MSRASRIKARERKAAAAQAEAARKAERRREGEGTPRSEGRLADDFDAKLGSGSGLLHLRDVVEDSRLRVGSANEPGCLRLIAQMPV